MSITHKDKKTRKMRGSRTCGYGMGKKHRGAGSRGGRGKAGVGKRGQQKKTFYFAKGIKPIGGKKSMKRKAEKLKIINIGELSKLAEKGIVDLKDYKLLGAGEIKEKLKVKVKHISKKAKEKLEKAGGELLQQ